MNSKAFRCNTYKKRGGVQFRYLLTRFWIREVLSCLPRPRQVGARSGGRRPRVPTSSQKDSQPIELMSEKPICSHSLSLDDGSRAQGTAEQNKKRAATRATLIRFPQEFRVGCSISFLQQASLPRAEEPPVPAGPVSTRCRTCHL